jgi:hypothetical protein
MARGTMIFISKKGDDSFVCQRYRQMLEQQTKMFFYSKSKALLQNKHEHIAWT